MPLFCIGVSKMSFVLYRGGLENAFLLYRGLENAIFLYKGVAKMLF